ncbi:MAG: TerC family protein [Pseudomonadota bacterium]
MIETIGNGWMWAGFVAFIGVMVAVDMLLLGRQGAHRVSAREAGAWSVVWIGLALAFNAALWWWLDGQVGRDVANQKALEFLTGYLVEKALAVDNIFVFAMIFSYFAVPAEYQRRVLLYGVLGAIVLRAVMILAGAVLIARFHWILYLFGALLLATGIKMLLFADHAPDLAKNPALRWLRGHLRVTDDYHGDRFSVRLNGVRHFTPLFLVLVMIELSDVVFAVDSIPAIYAVTTDPFIVFTSNMFAILGLRALYFVLADMAQRFRLLKYGLALVLVLIGAKMLLADVYKMPIELALGLVAMILATSVLASVWSDRKRLA